jgi:predicted nucleic acid-binding protein
MKLLHDIDFSIFEHSYLLVDTNVLIGSLNVEELRDLLHEFKSHNCALITIPSVFFEFIRGSNSIDSFNKRSEYLESLVTIFPIEKIVDQLEEFIVIYQKYADKAEYSDFLLAACAFHLDSSILTENVKDFPSGIFSKQAVITLYDDSKVRNYSILHVDKGRYRQARRKLR